MPPGLPCTVGRCRHYDLPVAGACELLVEGRVRELLDDKPCDLRGRALRIARSRLGRRPGAEDHAQTALMKLIETPPAADGRPPALFAWLHRVILRQLVDDGRSERGRQRCGNCRWFDAQHQICGVLYGRSWHDGSPVRNPHHGVPVSAGNDPRCREPGPLIWEPRLERQVIALETDEGVASPRAGETRSSIAAAGSSHPIPADLRRERLLEALEASLAEVAKDNCAGVMGLFPSRHGIARQADLATRFGVSIRTLARRIEEAKAAIRDQLERIFGSAAAIEELLP